MTNTPLTFTLTNEGDSTAYARAFRLTTWGAEYLLHRALSGDEIAAFLSPREDLSYNPFLLRGMRESTVRLFEAVAAGETIAVYGDYDADGIGGSSLLVSFLRNVPFSGGRRAEVYHLIPKREDGYGLSPAYVDQIARESGAKLLITVDCGTSDRDGVLRAQKTYGMDVIILDHHEMLQGLPPTPYFVNPQRPDDPYPFKGLCGAGVAYKFCQALAGTHVRPLYDLVAFSTIADMMPMRGENRLYIREGLQLQRENRGNLGIWSLGKVTAGVFMDRLSASDIGYRLAPRVNALGRMGLDTNLAARLFTTSDPAEAKNLAEQLDRANRDRREVTDDLTAEAIHQLGDHPSDMVCVLLEHAGSGVVGLIATRLAEHYSRPAIVLGPSGYGSGRGVGGFDMLATLDRDFRARFLDKLGGHPEACGFHTFNQSGFEAAARRYKVHGAFVGAPTAIDSFVTDFTPYDQYFAADLERLAPFGLGAPEPTHFAPGVTVRDAKTSADGKHLFLTVADAQGNTRRVLAFGSGSQAAKFSGTIDLLYAPDVNPRSGEIELRLRDWYPAGRAPLTIYER